LLGTAFAIYRPIVALATGLLGGLLVMLFVRVERKRQRLRGSAARVPRKLLFGKGSKRNIVWRALEYGFVTLPRDIGLSLLVGVVIAGAITATISTAELKPYLGAASFRSS